MKTRGPLIGFALITLLYLGTLIWLDAQKQVFARLTQLGPALVVMACLALGSFVVRFARWQWLLHRMGHYPPLGYSFLAYMSGFAFTATPGKVGELVRIRYLLPARVPAQTTLGVFVYERLFDLLAVLMLATFHATQSPVLMASVSAFVLVLAVVVLGCTWNPRLFNQVIVPLRRLHAWRLVLLLRTLRDGLCQSRRLATPLDTAISLGTGLMAWLFTAGAFVWLLHQLDIVLPWHVSQSIYPIAMLAGAASMIPGGMGSTEATIVALLMSQGIEPATAGLAAVGARLATLWFSILLGFLAMLCLNVRYGKGEKTPHPAPFSITSLSPRGRI
ncbi:UPF0104 family protein [Lautropia dentalis]|uniref:UPF0104 family protein n=1 Tax=Lautropia dentalis TaxID=2490857 RepID=A0A426FQT0_9BURK|nr:lysylphosphatidylglycerol synthase transmembrane domain-containing protein [Lautropia dentalis]RRN45004.1 UPF0104 family protein [Lautropia dentalis]